MARARRDRTLLEIHRSQLTRRTGRPVIAEGGETTRGGRLTGYESSIQGRPRSWKKERRSHVWSMTIFKDSRVETAAGAETILKRKDRE